MADAFTEELRHAAAQDNAERRFLGFARAMGGEVYVNLHSNGATQARHLCMTMVRKGLFTHREISEVSDLFTLTALGQDEAQRRLPTAEQDGALRYA